MRIGILSDIHANLPALEVALRDIRARGCDMVVSIGDAVAIGPYPSETLELLFAEGVVGLTGNHEEYLLKGFPTPRSGKNSPAEIEHQRWTRAQISDALRERVRAWPYEERIPCASGSIRLLHFAYDEEGIVPLTLGSEAELEPLFGLGNPIVVFGHTHRELDVKRKVRYLNPGAFGCSRDDHARYLIIDISGAGVEVQHRAVQFPRETLLGELRKRDVPARDEILKFFFGA